VALRFVDDFGAPLDSAEANALFDWVRLYADDGDGEFEPVSDLMVTGAGPLELVDGVQTLAIPDATPGATFSFGSPRVYWIGTELTFAASSASPNRFLVLHLRENGSAGEVTESDIPLSLELETSTLGTQLIEVLPIAGDADGDGLANTAEADTHDTDPLNPDSDGDGATDGLEVNTLGTNPLDADHDDDGLVDGEEISINTDPLDVDSDDDGLCDGFGVPGGCTPGDNCPAVSNGAQTNGDAFPAGDVCQCGNVDGAGGLSASDYQAAREAVVGRTPSGAFDVEFCDVNGDAACGVADLAILQRAVAGEPAAIQNACDGYRGP
jgi:hypothetical protein